MNYLISLGVAIALGLIIGLEREFRLLASKDRFAGIRTFPLVAILGSLAGLVSKSTSHWVLAAMSFAIVLLAAITYYVRSSHHPGITTEVTLVITFLLGAMCSLNLMREALAAAVLSTVFLSLKDVFHSFVSRITQEELFAFVKFIVLALVLLPFLPNEGYGPAQLLNPREICRVVVTISMLSFVSYVIMKFVGTTKGIIFSAVLGGLTSSTAVTWIFSTRTQENSNRLMYAAGIIAACSIMPLRIVIVTLIFTSALFWQILWPALVMAATGLGVVIYLLKMQRETTNNANLELGNPLNLSSALFFTAIYVSVLLLVHYSKQWFGQTGLIVSGVVSGLADVDAIAIAMSDLVGKSPKELPIYILLAAMISNNLLKLIVAAIRTHHAVKIKVIAGLAAITLAAAAYLVLLIGIGRGGSISDG